MLGQPRTTQRRARKVASDEGALRGDVVRLASRFGRYGDCLAYALARQLGEPLLCKGEDFSRTDLAWP